MPASVNAKTFLKPFLCKVIFASVAILKSSSSTMILELCSLVLSLYVDNTKYRLFCLAQIISLQLASYCHLLNTHESSFHQKKKCRDHVIIPTFSSQIF